MAGVLAADKENLMPLGALSANSGKRPNEWSKVNDQEAKRKALLRPSKRFTNVRENSSNVQQPSKPSTMGPPPPRIAAPSNNASSAARPKLVTPEQRKATVVSHSSSRLSKSASGVVNDLGCASQKIQTSCNGRWCLFHRGSSRKAELELTMQLALPAKSEGGNLQTLTLASLLAKASLAASTWPGSGSPNMSWLSR